MGEPVLAVEKLKIESNPFVPGAGGGRMGRPLQTSFGEVIRQIGLETPVVVVSGSAGTGKTQLANMVARACAEMGLTIRRIHRGDLMDGTAGERSDLLLVDEADSMTDATLQMLLMGSGKRPATTTVLLCLPSSVRRFSAVVDAVVVELTRLSQSDTRLYLMERATHAGLPDLFAPAALDLIVDASRGLPRSLWSIAGLAYFSAASAGAAQISRQNVADALASQITRPEPPEPFVPATPVVQPAPSVKLVAAPAPVADPPRAKTNVAYLAPPPAAAAPQTNPPPIADALAPAAKSEIPSATVPAAPPAKPIPGTKIEPVAPSGPPDVSVLPVLPAMSLAETEIERAEPIVTADPVVSSKPDAPATLRGDVECREPEDKAAAFDGASQLNGEHTADPSSGSAKIQNAPAPQVPAFEAASPIAMEKPDSTPDANVVPLNLVRDNAARDRKARGPVVILAAAASIAAVVVIPAMLIFGKSPSATNTNVAPAASLTVSRQVSVTPPPPASQAAIVNNDSAAAQKSVTGDSAKKSPAVSKPPQTAGNRPASAAKPPVQSRAAQPSNKTPANNVGEAKARVPAQPVTARAPVQAPPAAAAPAPVQAEAVAPADTAGDTPVQAAAAPVPVDPAAEAEARAKAVAEEVARIMAAQQQAERQKAADAAASEARAAAVRASIARDAANRVNAAMQEATAAQAAAQAAADAKAARETAAKDRRAFQNSLFGVAH